jgi:hypothetical protein
MREMPIPSDLSDFPLANSCGNGTYESEGGDREGGQGSNFTKAPLPIPRMVLTSPGGQRVETESISIYLVTTCRSPEPSVQRAALAGGRAKWRRRFESYVPADQMKKNNMQNEQMKFISPNERSSLICFMRSTSTPVIWPDAQGIKNGNHKFIVTRIRVLGSWPVWQWMVVHLLPTTSIIWSIVYVNQCHSLLTMWRNSICARCIHNCLNWCDIPIWSWKNIYWHFVLLHMLYN